MNKKINISSYQPNMILPKNNPLTAGTCQHLSRRALGCS